MKSDKKGGIHSSEYRIIKKKGMNQYWRLAPAMEIPDGYKIATVVCFEDGCVRSNIPVYVNGTLNPKLMSLRRWTGKNQKV